MGIGRRAEQAERMARRSVIRGREGWLIGCGTLHSTARQRVCLPNRERGTSENHPPGRSRASTPILGGRARYFTTDRKKNPEKFPLFQKKGTEVAKASVFLLEYCCVTTGTFRQIALVSRECKGTEVLRNTSGRLRSRLAKSADATSGTPWRPRLRASSSWPPRPLSGRFP